MSNSTSIKNDTKKLFRTKGSCSHTMFYILNREFGHTSENEERASDLFAGGILVKGHQCGLLWGSTLGVGAESLRKHDDQGQAIAMSMAATQCLVDSFTNRAGSVDCLEITHCNWSSKLSMAKYFFSGRFLTCFNLADKWAPEAIQSAKEGLQQELSDQPELAMSCASEVAKKLGASDAEVVTVAGFAGGIGLSGNACGALSAAIWLNALAWCRENPGKSPPFFSNPDAKRIFEEFLGATDSMIPCREVAGQRFETIAQHTDFVRSGGCSQLIDVLAQA